MENTMSMGNNQRFRYRKGSNQLPESDRFAVLAMNSLAGLILLIAVAVAAPANAGPLNTIGGYLASNFVTPSHSPGGGSAARAAARAAMEAATLSPAWASSVKASAAA